MSGNTLNIPLYGTLQGKTSVTRRIVRINNPDINTGGGTRQVVQGNVPLRVYVGKISISQTLSYKTRTCDDLLRPDPLDRTRRRTTPLLGSDFLRFRVPKHDKTKTNNFDVFDEMTNVKWSDGSPSNDISTQGNKGKSHRQVSTDHS